MTIRTSFGHLRNTLPMMLLLVWAVLLISGRSSAMVVAVDKDTYISSAEPDSNFGNSEFLKIKNNFGSPTFFRKVYLGFDVSNISPPYAGISLVMIVTEGEGMAAEGPQVFEVYGLTADASDTWDEFSITWEDAPENDQTSGYAFLSGMALLGSFEIIGNGTTGSEVSFSSAQLTSFVENDVNRYVTIAISRQTASDVGGHVHGFHSADSVVPGTGPRLDIQNPSGVGYLNHQNGLVAHRHFPNPFNPEISIVFELEKSTPLRVAIYDIDGRTIRNLASETFSTGGHTVTWDGRDGRGRLVSSGVYLYRLESPGFTVSERILLMK